MKKKWIKYIATAVKKGTATITAKTSSGKKVTCKITRKSDSIKYRFLAALLSAILFAGGIGEVTCAAEASSRNNKTAALESSISNAVSDGDGIGRVSAGDVIIPQATSTPLPAKTLQPDITPNSEEKTVYLDLSVSTLHMGGLLQERENKAGVADITLPQYMAMDAATYSSAEKDLLKAFDSFASKCDLSKYKISLEDIYYFTSDVLNSHPRYFFVSGCSANYNNEGYVTTVEIEYEYSKSKGKKMLKSYDAAMQEFYNGVVNSWSDMEKALYVNDYLASNCEYDDTLTRFSAYDAIVEKTAVCQGYALAYRAMAMELGLECELVTSRSLDHAWNMVKIDDNYYHVDVTWNDPDNSIGCAGHQYFMKSTSYFKGGHTVKDDWVVFGDWQESYANDTTYDRYFWNVVDSVFEYIDGAWYGMDGTGGSIARFTCDGKKFIRKKKLIKLKGDFSSLTENSITIAYQRYIGMESWDNRLYYSTEDTVYEYDFSNGKSTPIYTSDTVEIHGIYINSKGHLYCHLASGYSTGKTKKVATLSKKAYIDKTKQTIYVGSSDTLKLVGTTIVSAKSSNDKVATVSAKGKVTAKKAGKATITLKGKNGESYKCVITVKKPSINAKKRTLAVGKTFTLKLTGTTIKSVKSSNDKVATVTKKGVVTAKKKGKATITLKGKDKKSYKCVITVK